MPRQIDYRLTKLGYYQSDNLKPGRDKRALRSRLQTVCGNAIRLDTRKPDLITFVSVIVIRGVCLSRVCLMDNVFLRQRSSSRSVHTIAEKQPHL